LYLVFWMKYRMAPAGLAKPPAARSGASTSAISFSPAHRRSRPVHGPSPNATAKLAKYRYSVILWPPPNTG
jgi:hypothetical protein